MGLIVAVLALWLRLDVVRCAILALTIGVENLAGAMGSAAFVAYLSGLCRLAFTATQYALLSSLYALPGKFVGGLRLPGDETGDAHIFTQRLAAMAAQLEILARVREETPNLHIMIPFMVLPLYANLEKHDQALLDAAQDLGANAWQRFWRVTFPLSLPGIFSGSALVFIPVLGMFAIPEILGGKDDWIVGNMIKESFLGTRDWPFGSMLSLMLTVAVLAVAGAASWLAARGMRRA